MTDDIDRPSDDSGANQPAENPHSEDERRLESERLEDSESEREDRAAAEEEADFAAVRRRLRPHVRLAQRMSTSEVLAVIGGFGLYALLFVQTIHWTTDEQAPGIHPMFPLAALVFFLYPFRTHVVSRRLMQLAILTFVVWLAINLSGALFPFIVAFVIAFIASRLVDRLDRRGVPRWVASLSAVLIILGIYATIAFWLIPSLVGQMDQMLTAAQNLIHNAGSILKDDKLTQYLVDLGVPRAQAHAFVTNKIDPQVEEIATGLIRWLGAFLRNLSGIIEGVFGIVLIPFLVFYFLLDFARIRVFIRSTILQDNPEWVYYVQRVDTIVNSYLGGILITSSIVGSLAIIALTILGVPYALVLGLLIGLFNLIPTFGILINIVVAMVLFLFAPGSYVYNVLATVAVINVLHALNAYALEPRVLGERVGVHPVVVVASLLVFSHFLGFIGLLIAVPTTAVALMFLREWYRRAISLDTPVYATESDAPWPPRASPRSPTSG